MMYIGSLTEIDVKCLYCLSCNAHRIQYQYTHHVMHNGRIMINEKYAYTHHVMHNHIIQNNINLERYHLSERFLKEKTRVCKSQFEKNKNAMLADLMSGSFGIRAGTERIRANTNDICQQRTPNLSIA